MHVWTSRGSLRLFVDQKESLEYGVDQMVRATWDDRWLEDHEADMSQMGKLTQGQNWGRAERKGIDNNLLKEAPNTPPPNKPC